MLYLILIGIALILFGGFLVLVSFERSRGLRVAGMFRNALDARVARISFIATHVDWGAFIKHLLGTVFERVLHDAAHLVLQAVRTVERVLTREVKSLRERRGIMPSESTKEEHPFQARVQKIQAALRSARRASRKPRKTPES